MDTLTTVIGLALQADREPQNERACLKMIAKIIKESGGYSVAIKPADRERARRELQRAFERRKTAAQQTQRHTIGAGT